MASTLDRAGCSGKMNDRTPNLVDTIPNEVWAEGARLGWKLRDLRLIEPSGVLLTLEREASPASFAIELFPVARGEPSFYAAERVQVGHRDQLASRADERAWQSALMIFLARVADRELAAAAATLPVLFGLRVAAGDTPPESPTACMFATSTLTVDQFGGVKPCCLFTRPLVDADGSPFRLPEEPLVRVLASRDLHDVRRALADGERISECSRCWRAEQHGRTSKRMSRPLENRLAPARADFPLRMLSLFPSSLCNLRCRTCDARSSSSIASEQKRLLAGHPAAGELFGTTLSELRTLTARSWLKRGGDAAAWGHAQLGGLEKIEFLGGEPLLSDEHFDLLSACVDFGSAERISLHYATNGTLFPERAKELWPRFKAVHVQVSLDAARARFEYLRHPARWHEVEANVRALALLAPNIAVSANATTSIYNVLYLDELIEWCVQNGVPLSLNPLGSPRHFDPRALPPRAKLAVRERLARVTEPAPLAAELRALLDEMDSEDWSQLELPRFLAHTSILDQARGEDFTRTFPELDGLLR